MVAETAVAPRLVAPRLMALAERVLGEQPPVRIRAWDGSEAGPAGAPVWVVRSRRGLRRLFWSPGELGFARAYVAGDIDVAGDLTDALRQVLAWAAARPRTRPSPALLPAVVGAAVGLGVVGPPPAAPAAEARLSGRLHSLARDRAAIAHHYDVSSEFYALLLDPAMAYSCAYWPSDESSLADAQRDKLDLVCRKLGLAAGMRLLDIGCGWGSLAVFAAREYGVRVTGVTLSREQQATAVRRAAEAGVGDSVDIRLQDYREIADGPYDAIASLEMGEHVGAENYPVYAGQLFRLVRPEGRVLVQQMSRHGGAPGGGAFIERYIAPDMHMRPVGETIGLLENAGLELRDTESLREHYVRTIRAWLGTLEQRWGDAAVLLGGEEHARVWRLYLAGSALAFESGRMGVDQLLCARAAPSGASGFPARRDALTRAVVS